MNSDNKINVNYSSLIGLKAELLRKQTEVQAAKATKEVDGKPLRIKRPKTVTETSTLNSKSDESMPIEDLKTHKKSRLMLEAKTRLYSTLQKSRSNTNPNFLVDFERKTYGSSDSDEDLNKTDDYNADSDPDNDWVEYQDCFGRSRKCLREDLPKMQQEDSMIREKVEGKPKEKPQSNDLFFEDRIPEKTPDIEIMRKKWEEQTAKLADKANIHYQDVLYDEARAHGVAYYTFSQDEDKRAKQQENLFKLRKETEKKQSEVREVQEMKNKMEENRLRVARIRQRVRAKLPIDETDEATADDSTIASTDDEIQNLETIPRIPLDDIKVEKEDEAEKLAEVVKPKSLIIEIENKIEAFGKLLGKSNERYVMTQEEWVHKRRTERDSEFAPQYNNFKSAGYSKFNVTHSGDENQTADSIEDSKHADYYQAEPIVRCVINDTESTKTSQMTSSFSSDNCHNVPYSTRNTFEGVC